MNKATTLIRCWLSYLRKKWRRSLVSDLVLSSRFGGRRRRCLRDIAAPIWDSYQISPIGHEALVPKTGFWAFFSIFYGNVPFWLKLWFNLIWTLGHPFGNCVIFRVDWIRLMGHDWLKERCPSTSIWVLILGLGETCFGGNVIGITKSTTAVDRLLGRFGFWLSEIQVLCTFDFDGKFACLYTVIFVFLLLVFIFCFGFR